MIIDRDSERKFIESRNGNQEPADGPQANERDIQQYSKFLGINTEKLSGKVVLNIGAGRTGSAEKSLSKAGATVIALSPIFADNGPLGSQITRCYTPSIKYRIRTALGINHNKPVTIVAGVAEQIPLSSNSVDLVIALYSVPVYSNNDEEVFKEIIRVIIPSGKAVMFPIPENKKEIFQKILSDLNASDITFTDVKEEGDTVYPRENTYRLSFSKPE